MPDAKFYFNSEFVIVRNYDEFVNFIRKNGLPNIISFDHDLADEHYSSDMHASTEVYNKNYETFQEKTGMDCAKWLVDYCLENGLQLPDYVVHSANPVGKKNIESYLLNAKKHLL